MDRESSEYVVGDEDHRLRIDRFLMKAAPQMKRHEITRLLRTGAVRLAGRVCPPRTYVKRGDRISIDPAAPPSLGAPRELVRSEMAIAVAKPPGIPTNPTGHPGEDLRTWLEDHLRSQSDGPIGSSDPRPGIVHRLDRDTSGIVLFSLTGEAYRLLEETFRKRTVRKTYLALVAGTIRPRRGTIDLPLLRGRSGRIRTDPHGLPARTDYRTVRATDRCTLLSLRPRSGRTHQIRVHLASLDRPIAGDPIYGDPRRTLGAPRLWLHASRIDLPPEIASSLGLPGRIVCPLWEDLAAHLERIGFGYETRNT